MSEPIRALLVEDEADLARELGAACLDAIEGEVEVTVASSPVEATDRLGSEEFDLVVHDLADDVELFRAIAREHPGLPVIVVSAGQDPALINELLAAARKEDIYGTDREQPMISFHRRDPLDGALEGIRATVRSLAELAALPLKPVAPLELAAGEERAVQIFARRTGAAVAKVTGLSGGLSGAKTVVVDAADGGGMKTAHVVGKLSAVGGIPGAVDGYENAIPDLPAGLGAALAGVVTAGARGTGAVFYRLADDYRRTWFDCLAESPGDAAEVVRRLHGRFAERYERAASERRTVGEVRRAIVSDEEMRDFAATAPSIEHLEALEVEVSRSIQHRDLHGLNVLVSDSTEPLLIDYDNYAPANSALDPLTLELSAVFHRDERAQGARKGWPSAEQASSWADLDSYLDGCPYPEAIRACREWALAAAASDGELPATLVGVAFRQFWFENTDKELAAALLKAGEAEL